MKARVDARRERLGADQVWNLAQQVKQIIVTRGKKTVLFDMTKAPNRETLLAHLLGPTGNLRAPAIRRGKMLLVGFSADLYRDRLS